MNQQQGPRIRIIAAPRSGLVGQVVYFLLGIFVLVLAFFFIGIALIAGAILAMALLVRWWWLKRRLPRTAPDDDVVEGEYTVVESVITDQRAPVERQADAVTEHPSEKHRNYLF